MTTSNTRHCCDESLVFTGCSMTDSTATPGGGRRRQVVVGGKRVKTIDVHAHCVVKEALDLLGQKLEDQRGPGLGEVGSRRIAEMDEQGIDMQALSINPLWYHTERDVAEAVVRIQNEKLADWCGQHPDRFVAFASVALQFPELAAQQLEHAVKKLGLRGAAVGTSIPGKEFSDPYLHPFWKKAEELGVLIFIHPRSTPELNKRFGGNGWLANTIGNPLDTTIALSHLIFDGTLDRFPGLKICSAHGGGYLPSYAPRSDNALRVAPEMDTGVKLKKKPTEYLRDMYYDTLVFTDEALRHLAHEVGVDRLVIGTDHYCARPPFALEHLHQRDAEHLVYRNPKPVRGTAPRTRPAALVLTPLELITKIAALVPPPRVHRHRYYGVLAPNASLRAVVTALAPAAVPPAPTSAATREEPHHRAVSRYLWAMLLARIYEAFPLQCPICHASMRIIAFVNDLTAVGKVLDHIGESTQPPRIAPARGPPLWEAAAAAEQAGNDLQWDSSAQPAPEIEFDQRIAW